MIRRRKCHKARPDVPWWCLCDGCNRPGNNCSSRAKTREFRNRKFYDDPIYLYFKEDNGNGK